MSTLVVQEIFPAWQGEGPSAGQACVFIRLMGCNLSCSWALPGGGRSPCDESQTWDGSRFDLHGQGTRMDAATVAAKALGYGTGMVVITGGEPLLHQHQPGWPALLADLGSVRVEVETNGTIVPDGDSRITQYNVSPKLAAAGQGDRAINTEAIAALLATGRAVFKFVVTGPAGVVEAAGMCDRWGIPPTLRWVMPAGTDPVTILGTAARAAPAAAAAGFNLTLRQHWLIYPEGEPR